MQSALDASTSGTTTLLKNTSETISVSSSASKTLNLNGKTLTGTLTNNGTLTINGNGTITTSDAYTIKNNKTLTIQNGSFIGSGTETQTSYNERWMDKAVIYNPSGSTVNINGGTITSNDNIKTGLANGGSASINGATIETTKSAHAVFTDTTGNTVMNSGTVKASYSGSQTAFMVHGDATINGGSIVSSAFGYVARNGKTSSIKNCSITVSSGGVSVLADTNASSIIITDSYLSQSNSNGEVVSAINGSEIRINNTTITANKITGTVLWINQLQTYYSAMWWGAAITQCPSWPSNGSPYWYNASYYTNAQYGNYYACIIDKAQFSSPTNSWTTHLYNGSTFVFSSGWTWK